MFSGDNLQKSLPKKVLITGCSTGIGLALSERLATEGYIVFATTRSLEKAIELQKCAAKFPRNVMIEQFDIQDSEADIQKFAEKIGKVDILINNAGYGLLGSAYGTTDVQRRHIFDVNYFGTINLTNAVLDLMIKSENPTGKILFLGSIVSPLVDLKQSQYSATKSALEHYAADLRHHLAHAGYQIKVAGIHPGPVITNFPAAADVGERFSFEKHPLPHTKRDIDEWRALMKVNGQPVSQTVETVMHVLNSPAPAFWNPTHPDVHDAFAAVYLDPTGGKFADGPGLKPGEKTKINDVVL